VHGTSKGSAYNGPLRVGRATSAVSLQRWWRLSGGELRPGNVHTPMTGTNRSFQRLNGNSPWVSARPFAPTALAKPEIHEAVEERGVQYAIRMRANESAGMGFPICYSDRQADPATSHWLGTTPVAPSSASKTSVAPSPGPMRVS